MEHTDYQNFPPEAREHAQHPRNRGPMSHADGHALITGQCGDTMEIWLGVRDGRIHAATFATEGCASSQACGSVATCLAEGKSVTEARALGHKEILDALGGLPRESEHCALLAADALKAACEDHLERVTERSTETSGGAVSTCESCSDTECSASNRQQGETQEAFEDRRKLESRLCRIRHKVVVLSGKGGVGKSTIAVNLAIALMMSGKRVGLLDVDIHGPSIPTMLGLEHEMIHGDDDELAPVDVEGLEVMSLGFFLRNQDDAVIWRGPLKMGMIKQFLRDVAWGDLDYLVIDSPPGTGDEPLSVCQLIGNLDGAVIVTTPQKVAAVDVRKAITFCRELRVPVLGILENMSGFACPKCGEVTPILLSGGGRRIAMDMNVRFLGSIPMDPKIAEACDRGQAFIRHYAEFPTARIMRDIIMPIVALVEGDVPKVAVSTQNEKED